MTLAAVAIVIAGLILGSLVVTPETRAFYFPPIEVVLSGNGSGEVTNNGNDGFSCIGHDVTCNDPIGGYFLYTAIPLTGSSFLGWTPDSCYAGATTNPCQPSGAKPAFSIDAVFGLLPEKVTVAKRGDGSGTVATADGSINCGTTCSHTYDYGTSVSLVANTAPGSSFEGWSGACTGKAACTLSMKAAQGVTATFLKNCLVPKLRGKTLSKARSALLAHDCTVGTITKKPSKLKRGRVISQKPAPGRQLTHGAKVGMVVSTGKA